jgi:hypothetical protein
MLSCVSPGDPFAVELMPPEGTFVVIGTVFPFTVHTATKVQLPFSVTANTKPPTSLSASTGSNLLGLNLAGRLSR